MTSILENYEQWAKEKQEERDAALPIAVAQLQAIGRAIQSDLPETIESIEVEYCGCGDDGYMDEMRVQPQKEVPNGDPLPRTKLLLNGEEETTTYQPMKDVDHCDLPEKVTLTLPGEDEEQEYDVRQAIEDIAFEILENCHPGWEISDGEADGGSGTVSLDFPSLKVRLDHQAHYVGRQDYEYEWEVAA